MKEDNPICYAGMDDMGNILAAIVHDDDNPARTALTLAMFVMEGMHVMAMEAGSIREVFGREFEGPNNKIPKFRVQVSYVDNHGTEIHLSEGDTELKPDNDDDDYKPMRVKGEDYPTRANKGDEAAHLAHLVLRLIGVSDLDLSGIRTMGDVERLRERIAQAV